MSLLWDQKAGLLQVPGEQLACEGQWQAVPVSLWGRLQACHALLTQLALVHGAAFACGRCWQRLAVPVLEQAAELQLPAVPVPVPVSVPAPVLEQAAELQVSAVLELRQAAALQSLPVFLQACTTQHQTSTTHSSSCQASD